MGSPQPGVCEEGQGFAGVRRESDSAILLFYRVFPSPHRLRFFCVGNYDGGAGIGWGNGQASFPEQGHVFFHSPCA